MPHKNSIKYLKEPQIRQSIQELNNFPQHIVKIISNPEKIQKSRKSHLKIKSTGDLEQQHLISNQQIHLEPQSYFYNKIKRNLIFSDLQLRKKSEKNQNQIVQSQIKNDFMLTLPSFNKNSVATAESYTVNSKLKQLNDYSFYEQNSIIIFFNEQKQLLSAQDFDIINYCGQGVYGSVHKARHLASNCLFALKKISKSIIIDQVEKQALKNQVKIHNKLNHPNIIKFYDVFINEDSIYFVLELCNDGNLYEILKKKKRFQQKQARKIIFQICNALNYLHKNNIIHRDIKAQNILIHQNVAKICDFGWATEGGTSQKILCGTPAYISPEIIQQKLYDKKVDVWSMGILIFELIYGYLPFRINSQNELQKIVTDELKFPLSTEVSQNCKDFIKKCLQKQAKYRWDIDNLLKHPFLKRATDA